VLGLITNKILCKPNDYTWTAVCPLITLGSAGLNERSEIKAVACHLWKRNVVLVLSFRLLDQFIPKFLDPILWFKWVIIIESALYFTVHFGAQRGTVFANLKVINNWTIHNLSSKKFTAAVDAHRASQSSPQEYSTHRRYWITVRPFLCCSTFVAAVVKLQFCCSPFVAAVANLQLALTLAFVAAETSILLLAFRRRCCQTSARFRRCWNFIRLLY